MKNEFVNNCEILRRQASELHYLTVSTCEMCGGSYEENLNGAMAYFSINGERFKITIEKV